MSVVEGTQKDKFFSFLDMLKQRVLGQEVPEVEHAATAICLVVLNIFIPGSGTLLAALLTKEQDPVVVADATIGFAQFLMSFFFVGWLWSVWWGVLIYRNTTERKTATERSKVMTDEGTQPMSTA